METKLSFTLILCAVCILYHVSADSCPDYCDCSLYNGRNLANCSSRHLANAYLDIPPEVELLNLSHNDIMELENDCFKNYKHTIQLFLQNNSIQSIELDTFSQLRQLQIVDLSYNHLESFDNRILELNYQLVSLNLEGNRFMTLDNVPIIISLPLRILNLRNSHLNYLNSEMFAAVPQLQNLDISQNSMIVLNLQAFNKTNQLLELNAKDNLWNCEDVTPNMNFLRSQGVHVLFDECQIKSTEKFQRMQVFEEDIKVKQKWRKVYNEAVEEDDNLKAEKDEYCQSTLPTHCMRYKTCFLRFLQQLQEGILIYKTEELESKSIDVLTDLNVSFLLGLAAGIVSTVLILTLAFCFKACLDIKKKQVVHTQSEVVAGAAPPRRQPRRSRRRADPNRAVVRQEMVYAPGADNFIARLLGRPAHQHYYRAINQNTANLIRRLSRSNLFNNRLSQHFLDRIPTEANFTSYMEPEEPPPSYGEVVVMINDGTNLNQVTNE